MAFISITNNIFESNVFIYSHLSQMNWSYFFNSKLLQSSWYNAWCNAIAFSASLITFALTFSFLNHLPVTSHSRCSVAFIWLYNGKRCVAESSYQLQQVYSWKFECSSHRGFSVLDFTRAHKTCHSWHCVKRNRKRYNAKVKCWEYEGILIKWVSTYLLPLSWT